MTIDTSETSDGVNAMVADDQGRITLVGYAHTELGLESVLARIDAGGDLDASFGDGGVVLLNVRDDLDELVALALDVQIRKATKNARGLDDVIRLMYERFGKTGRPYAVDDVLKAANEVGGTDFGEFFAKYVSGKEFLSIDPYLRDAGMRVDSFVEETYVTRRADATPAERAIFSGIFEGR